MTRLTIGILALNEAARIDACVRSAAFADQVLVMDGGSTDDTQAIARAAGAEVLVRADWAGFGEQRTRLLHAAAGDWLFYLDADETIPPPLADEIRAAVSRNQPLVGEIVWEQHAFGGSLARMSAGHALPRLFPRAALLGFEGAVHEGPRLARDDLPRLRFATRLVHHSRETVHASLLKLAQYVQLGALKRARAGKRGGVWRGLASGGANFIRVYLFQRGFLCGRAGFLHSYFVGLECFFRYVALEVDRDRLTEPARRA
jgi:glycosyltransferase involved in cell wall biosynthesis